MLLPTQHLLHQAIAGHRRGLCRIRCRRRQAAGAETAGHDPDRTGLKLTYAVLDKLYQLKREASQRFLDSFPIRFDQNLPDWNYTLVPTHY